MAHPRIALSTRWSELAYVAKKDGCAAGRESLGKECEHPDLDLDRGEDEEEWERRVMAVATTRIATERARLERLGIIDANGDLVSTALPPDMLAESDTTLETG